MAAAVSDGLDMTGQHVLVNVCRATVCTQCHGLMEFSCLAGALLEADVRAFLPEVVQLVCIREQLLLLSRSRAVWLAVRHICEAGHPLPGGHGWCRALLSKSDADCLRCWLPELKHMKHASFVVEGDGVRWAWMGLNEVGCVNY